MPSVKIKEPTQLSIIIPVYNESESIDILHQSLHDVLDTLSVPWELILVDDGSRDNSLEVLEKLADADPMHTSVVALRRNFGQTAAIAAGIDHASGNIIILMDADLQNDPADIPMILEKIEQGYDVVSGWRVNRQDNYLTRYLPSAAANWLISKVTGVNLHDYGCTLKAYRREVITGFRLYGEMHRFIPAYASSVGAKIVEVPVHHHARKYGKAKYGLDRTLKVILDLFTVKFLMDYTAKPMRIFGGTGIFLAATSMLVLLFLMIRRLAFHISPFDSPLFIVSIMVMMMGFQSILMGLIAELLMRTYHESQQKTTYTVRQVLNRFPLNEGKESSAHSTDQ
ncbi:MAG: glycosyltransferase family 2 protein [Chloroflexota bacterium]